jgi:5-methyltetrahydrofolate--homocysteine methyltransferase
MADPAEVALAIRAAKSVADWPVLATYAFGRGPDGAFRTMMGSTVEQTLRGAIDAGADVVGANCGIDLSLDEYVRLARELVAAAGSVPVMLQPNAGTPRNENGTLIYRATPEDFAAIVPALLSTGVRVIGGCCGTTPAHLRAAALLVHAE